MKWMAGLLLIIRITMIAPPALADNWAIDSQNCNNAWNRSSDKVIQGCSAIINAGRGSKVLLGAAYRNRGDAYAENGQYENALSDYQNAVAKGMSYISGRIAVVERKMAASAVPKVPSAVTTLPPSTGEPTDPITYDRRGLSYANAGQFDLAILEYNRAIALNPNYANAYNNRGNALYIMGEYDRAIKDHNKTIALNPKFAPAYSGRGSSYFRKGDYARAIEDYDKAIAIDPSYGFVYYRRGDAYVSKGEYEKALSDFRQALVKVPSSDTLSDKIKFRIAKIELQFPPTSKPDAAPTDQPQIVQSIGKRVALVIGNGAYQFAPELLNPRNDADAMSRMLSSLGFQVISGMDLRKPELEAKVREFASAAKTADLSLFFYAGHGLQVAGQNYLVPVDAKVEDDTALNFELVNAAVVTNYMGGDKKVGIVLLDACRDNPFTRSLKRSLGATRAASVSQGLADISSDGGGLVIGYATAPGDVAADGDGINSPFTTALLKRLPTKGTELELVLKRVKADVIEATRNGQRPWTNSDLSTEVYLQPSN